MSDELDRLRRRADREHRARVEAERLAEAATRELHDANVRLREAAERASGLLSEALDAGDAERAMLSSSLHEGALQTLLAARQDLLEAIEGDHDLLPTAIEHLDAAVAEVRGLVAWLHPVALDHVGLATALVTTLQAEGARLGLEVEVDAQDGSRGAHDGVVLAVARDLVARCGEGGGRVAVTLRREDAETVLAVLAPGPCEASPRSVERLRAVGGSVAAGEGGETVVRVPFEARTTGPVGRYRS